MSPLVIEGEVIERTMRTKKARARTTFWRRIPAYAYIGGLLVSCFVYLGWQLLATMQGSEDKSSPTWPAPQPERLPTANTQAGEKKFVIPVELRPAAEHRTGDAVLHSWKTTPGRGVLTLENGSEGDAVVSIISEATGHRVRSIYIRESDKGVIRSLGPGSYWVKIAKGWGWDDSAREFSVEPSYFKIPHPYLFTETYEGDGVRFSTVSLTLYKVPGGNVSQEAISKSDFLSEN